MKWFLMFLTLSIRQLNNKLRGPSLRQTLMDVLQEVQNKSKKLVNLVVGGFAAMILFCGGFFIALINLAGQWDQTNNILWSATLISGLALMGISLIAVALLYRSYSRYEFAEQFQRNTQGKSERRQKRSERNRSRWNEEQPQNSPSSLEAAAAALVMDFVHERQKKRDLRAERDYYEYYNAENDAAHFQNEERRSSRRSRRQRNQERSDIH